MRHVAATHFADEAQGQMQLLARLPARARNAALDQHDGLRHGPGTARPQTASPRKPSQRQAAPEQQQHRAIEKSGADDGRRQSRHVGEPPHRQQCSFPRAYPSARARGDGRQKHRRQRPQEFGLDGKQRAASAEPGEDRRH